MPILKDIIKHPSLRTFGVFAGGNLFVAVLGGIGGLIQGRWIGPEVLGEFGKYGILTAYFNIGLVLVHDGLARQYPYLLGKGNKEQALKVASHAKWWYLFLCWIFIPIFALLSLFSIIKGDYHAAVGWAVQIPIVFVALFGAYLGVMYRTSNDFKRLSYNSVIAKVVDFSSLIFVNIWGYWGLAMRSVFGNMTGLYMNIHYLPIRVKSVFDVKGLRELAKISLPLSVPGYLVTSFLTASVSYIILITCGEHGLGIYGMALAFQGMSLIPILALHQMFITKLNYKYGETDDFRACLKYIKVPTLLSVGAATVLALILWLVIGPFIRALLPKYEDAIPIIRILSLQLPIYAARAPLLIINTALWYKNVVYLTLVQFFTPLLSIAIFPKTLNVIALCVTLGGVGYLIAGYSILEWEKLKEKKYKK